MTLPVSVFECWTVETEEETSSLDKTQEEEHSSVVKEALESTKSNGSRVPKTSELGGTCNWLMATEEGEGKGTSKEAAEGLDEPRNVHPSPGPT